MALPAIHESILVPSTPAIPRAGEGSALLLAADRVLLVYSEFQGNADHDRARLVQRTSHDQGCTWSEPELFLDPGESLNVMSASLLRMTDNRLALVFLDKKALHDCRPCICLSHDNGESWSSPMYLTDIQGYYVVNNDRLVQTRSGRLLVPCAYSPEAETARSPECGVLYSDDKGKTWQRGQDWIRIQPENTAPAPRIEGQESKRSEPGQPGEIVCQEPGVVELENGDILMWVRTNGGYMYVARSSDQGDTWSALTAAREIVSPLGPQSIKRIPSTSRLICVYTDRSGVEFHQNPQWHWRTPLSVATSDDNAETWQRIPDLELDQSHNYCYVSILFIKDRVLFTYYQSMEESTDGQEIRHNLRHLKVKVVDLSLFLR